MAMVCPQCHTAYEQRWQCPVCETRLLFHYARRFPDNPSQPLMRRQQRPWERIFIGLVLAQGLFYGLRHLVTAGVLAIQGREAAEQMEMAASGILLLQILRMFALLVGAVFTGAGQQQAALLGALIGAWNGVFSVLVLPDSGQMRTPIALLGQPLLQTVMGAIGGWIGAVVWEPLSETTLVETPLSPSRRLRRRNGHLLHGPVAWGRVAAGTILAVAGTLTATLAFEKILDFSRGTLATANELQDRLIILEIKALALLLGGALAGAATRNGLRQGLCVGLISAALLMGIEMYFGHRLAAAGYTALAALSLSLIGGWFGSQLVPPVFRKPRRHSRGGVTI